MLSIMVLALVACGSKEMPVQETDAEPVSEAVSEPAAGAVKG